VSCLTDQAKALAKARDLHSFLVKELQLPIGRKAASVETFAAFMGMMRSCNPLHVRRRALAELPVRCPLVRRFPEVLTGKLLWYKDVEVGLSDVIDRGGAVLDANKMWRLMVWIFLGNGGRLHQAWHALDGTPCTRVYRKGDLRQPLEVLRFVIHAVHETGSLMRVIGSDGLDKKSRLAEARILFLLEWHKAVPALVEAFHRGSDAFDKALLRVRGLKGDLTRKEILILFSASRHPDLSVVGEPTLPFGQGAKNGAKAFLGVPQRSGPSATRYYHQRLKAKIPKIEATMARLFPALPSRDLHVTLGDLEPCLCAAFVYSGLVVSLRKILGEDCCRVVRGNDQATWRAIEHVRVPAGFYAYTRGGRPQASGSEVHVPRLPYKRFRLAKVPARRFLSKKCLLRHWGPAPKDDGPAAKRCRRMLAIKDREA